MAGQARHRESDISARESQVLAALAEHLTNAEIGARLFISTRTVESHVSSLLRKLPADDRRGLAALAGDGRRSTPSTALPPSLTPFIGRATERAELATLLRECRLVTAVGPGGVGKTRLALSVAADEAPRFADGVWYVDLVPVTDGAMIAAAIAEALGLGERPAAGAADVVASWLTNRSALLVLDNCEHLLDGVVVLLERLLAAGPGLVVLATSRARLLVPFERVFPVPGLSVEGAHGGAGDAIELFSRRAAAAGNPAGPGDSARIVAICRALDGMALAIELAAARYPSVGLDGLEAGLADRLRLLSGGARMDDRHRSLRSTLDWSHALLSDAGRAVLRRVSVFAEAFTSGAATAVLADWEPVPTAEIPVVLAGLAEQSLLSAIAGPDGTRYRALETIRQYGFDRLVEAGESVQARSRHLAWCLDRIAELEVESVGPTGVWRARFDAVADELRSALTWASHDSLRHTDAHRLALGLADLCFRRGLPGESQRRYTEAAELAPDDAAAADALRKAAGAAESRHVGDDSVLLRARAAEAALRAGDRAGAAVDLARNAELIHRAPGLMATRRLAAEADASIERGWGLADGDPMAQARLVIAEAASARVADDPNAHEVIERALGLAREVGDPLTESAALDQLTAHQLSRGEIGTAAASAARRVDLLAGSPVTAAGGLEFFDAFIMAAESAVAAGDLAVGRRMAERLRDLPFYREEGHLASARLILVTVLTGDWSEAVGLAARFREGWERAGRPRAGNLSPSAYAAATVHGLRGDDDARAAWLDIVSRLETPGRPVSEIHFGEFFDAMLMLHRGRPGDAVTLLRTPPEDFRQWYSGLWRPWYAALWAEAAVLTGGADVADRIARARRATAGNPIATALVDRAEALRTPGGDRDGLLAAAATLAAAGCRYQWARSLVLAGGAHRTHGAAALAAMGAAPMAEPR